ncbi:hypothetical protein [Weissella minor]|uniref:hypothetical protein n=1 Tax=Weissella minor TaxID=1620 RepID=UPI003AF30269
MTMDKSTLHANIAKKIKQYRKSNHLTQAQLADLNTSTEQSNSDIPNSDSKQEKRITILYGLTNPIIISKHHYKLNRLLISINNLVT